MFHEMAATLGGRASEQVNFGKISTGALNDLERVTKQAVITSYSIHYTKLYELPVQRGRLKGHVETLFLRIEKLRNWMEEKWGGTPSS